nr:unnamed protein product [Digitaria exilis]
MMEDRAHRVADEPAAAGRQRSERKKRKWDQPAEDLVSAAMTAAAVAGLPVINLGALPGVALPGVTAYGAAALPSAASVPFSLPPHIAPSVLQNASAALQKLSQAKIPDETIAREIVINDADPSVRYKLTKRQTQDEIQRCTSTVIITRGKYHPPNGQPDGEKPLYLHISAGSQDQYINHIMKETGVTVVLRGKDSENLSSCLGEASQQPLHLYLTSMHLKSLEAAKVLAENLLDTIAAEFGASRISSSKVYGAVPPPQQLLAGVETPGPRSDVHSTLGTNALAGASHSFASTGAIAPIVAPAVTLQYGGPTYSGVPPPSNMICPIPPVNGGTFYSGYGDIYPQATPLQQVAFTLKHASSSTTQVAPMASTLTSRVIEADSSLDVGTDKRSRRKFQELPVSQGPTTESQVKLLVLILLLVST